MKVNCRLCDKETKGAIYCSKQCWIVDAFPKLEERAGLNRGIYKYFTLDKFIFDSREEKILEKTIKKYLGGKLNRGLLIYGSVGVGKTHLIFAVVREVMKTLTLEAQLFNIPRMIADYKDSHFDERIIIRAETVSIAIFDDLGSEYKSEMSKELLTRIVDQRLIENRLTYFTSNLTPEMIGDQIDVRLISRIKALTYSVEMTGKDKRNK